MSLASPRWNKVLRDLWLHKSRTALVGIAISIGIIGAGSVLNTWALLQGATRAEFRASEPASATIRTSGIDEALLEQVRSLPSIKLAEARSVVAASVNTATGWRTAQLMTAPDLASVKIGAIKSEEGEWPPRDGALAVESSSLEFAGVAVGDRMTIRIADSVVSELPVVSVARDVGLAPGWMEHVVYAFVTPATLEKLGVSSEMDQLRIVVRDVGMNRELVRSVAEQVKALVEKSGRVVTDVEVPVPGRHIHAAQIDSLLFTQGAFGALALLLSAFLVVNLISAMLAGQVREIGIMKAIGARPRQIASMYFGLALVIGLGACAVAVPVAWIVGKQYASFTADLLNFDISGARIPGWIVLSQLGVGVLLPLAAASIPVIRGSRLSVSEALRDLGIAERPGHSSLLLRRASGVARPLLLSIRNAFRRRSRMILTLLTLAMGGAVYLGAGNLNASVMTSVDTLFGAQRFDMVLRFSESHAVDSIESIVRGVEGVAAAEAWSGARAAVNRTDGSVGNAFPITAPPAGTTMMTATIREGRWLRSGDTNALVINSRLVEDEPQLELGSTVTLNISGASTTWTVVGIAQSNPSPIAYAARETIAPLVAEGKAGAVVVASAFQGSASQFDLIQRLRARLGENGLEVRSQQLMVEQRKVVEDHLLMVAGFLGIMGQLIIVVGGLGLASTMSLGVLERTREIGVMRAIGAGHRAILGMIQIEGLVVALLSWIVAIPLSAPMSVILSRAFGRIMFPVPARLEPQMSGVLSWLLVVVLVSLVACAWPALRAMRVPTARALSYE
jgi:putative ABC transport system permease protein